MAANRKPRHTLLTLEEEVTLAKNMKHGCRQSRNKLILAHLPLVYKIASGFKGKGASYDEFVSIGSEALVENAAYYELGKGARFSTFIRPWIQDAMQRVALRRGSLVSIPDRPARWRGHLERAQNRVLLREGRQATTEELSQILHVPEKDVRYFQAVAASTCSSLDAPMTSGSVRARGDMIVDESNLSPEQALIAKDEMLGARKRIDKLLKRLHKHPGISSRDKQVFLHLHEQVLQGTGGTRVMRQVGVQFGISHERVRQVVLRIIRLLEDPDAQKPRSMVVGEMERVEQLHALAEAAYS